MQVLSPLLPEFYVFDVIVYLFYFLCLLANFHNYNYFY